MGSSKASFTSYVDFSISEEGSSLNTSDRLDGGPHLISDESIIAFCEQVILFPAMSEHRQGILGSLYCTEFRLSFVPALTVERQGATMVRGILLCDRFESSLCNIDNVQIKNSKSDKLRPLSGAIGVTDKLCEAKIHCKDLRSFHFDFKTAQGGKEREVVNAILHFAFPSSMERLFAFKYSESLRKQNSLTNGDKNTGLPPSFNTKNDWACEMERLEKRCLRAGMKNLVANNWRVTQMNLHFVHCDSYPEYFVLPRTLVDQSASAASGNWTLRRIPVWCWSSPYGCALLRSAERNVISEVSEKQWQWYPFEQEIANAHPQQLPPLILNVGIPVHDIRNASDGLKSRCSAESVNQYWFIDSRWLTELDQCQWLTLVAKCLGFAAETVQTMNRQENPLSVLLIENEGRDMTCIVSSLAQLCMDRYFRTLTGFEVLLQKEWVAMGHPFGLRLHGLEYKRQEMQKEQMAPVFLLFLDCVHNLLEQYPLDFEFSQHYLVALWDQAMTGLDVCFLPNSMKERTWELKELPSAWRYTHFYSQDYVKMFKNPLYAFKHVLGPLIENSLHELGDIYLGSKQSILVPRYQPPDIELWQECFLRWCGPAQLRMGGSVQCFVQHSADICELATLLSKTKKLDAKKLSGFLFANNQHLLDVDEPVNSGYPYNAEVLPTPEEAGLPGVILRPSGLRNLEQRPASSMDVTQRKKIGPSWAGFGRPVTLVDGAAASAQGEHELTASKSSPSLLRRLLLPRTPSNAGTPSPAPPLQQSAVKVYSTVL